MVLGIREGQFQASLFFVSTILLKLCSIGFELACHPSIAITAVENS
jgi:hypothetical protein